MLGKIEKIIDEKIKQFDAKNINVDREDIKNFLDNVYFKYNELTEENLKVFLEEDNLNDIISFLMADALN